MENILELHEVRKSYQDNIAVNDVSFNVPKSCIFGLLGPNGAGKTSLIRIITTITGADSGTILLNGERLNNNHPSIIGYMPEERGLYRKMKVGDHLIYLARLKGLKKADAKNKINEWLEKFGIADWWDKKVEELSKGMQQKIQFISTVVHQPSLLILDEPFSGLDPVNTNLIKKEIQALKDNGTSIIFSTHRMEQVEEICEHILLINEGKNVLEGRVDAIRHQFKDNLFEIVYRGILPAFVKEEHKIVKRNTDSITLQLKDESDSNKILSRLIESGIHIQSFKELLPSLNEIFIKQVSSKTLAAI